MADAKELIQSHLGPGESIERFSTVESNGNMLALTDRRLIEVSVGTSKGGRDKAVLSSTDLTEVCQAELMQYGEEPTDDELLQWAGIAFVTGLVCFGALFLMPSDIPDSVVGGAILVGLVGFVGGVGALVAAYDTDDGFLSIQLETAGGTHEIRLPEHSTDFAEAVIASI